MMGLGQQFKTLLYFKFCRRYIEDTIRVFEVGFNTEFMFKENLFFLDNAQNPDHV